MLFEAIRKPDILVPNYILLPMLAALLLISAVKVWQHQ
jgi:hypothetical protein